MRFCSWYPLLEAGDHAPAEPGILQVRVAEGLLRYPTGQSAMLHYELAADLRAAAAAFAAAHPDRAAGWLARHLTAAEGGAAGFHARLVRDFVTRFGAEPTVPPIRGTPEASP